jgi:hypothetical protein
MKTASTAALLAVALTACTAMEPAPCDRARAASSPPNAAPPSHAHPGYEQQTARMRQMHERAMTARTLEERAAWRQEQMKVMQEGMAMMKQMRGPAGGVMGSSPDEASPPSGSARMGSRMEMMDLMMQMMTDREMMPSDDLR